MGRRFWCALAAALAVPYAGTVIWTGTTYGTSVYASGQSLPAGGRQVILDREEESGFMSVEEYLPGVLACQIPWDLQPEAKKAQAVIARTYIYKVMEAGGNWQEIPESALDLDYQDLSRQDPEMYQKLQAAAEETAGMVMVYEGEYIDPMFCRISAGTTRKGDDGHPYLQPAACPQDPESQGYLKVIIVTPEEFAQAAASVFAGEEAREIQPEGIWERTQIISKDEAGYVEQIQIDGFSFTGDQIRFALGLPSSCFSLEEEGGNIRITVRGSGHGYGLSQAYADTLAAQGQTAEEILKYFYKNIDLITE